MLILAADTSHKQGSIALARGGPGGTLEVIEVAPITGGTFSAQLVPQVAALLAKHGFQKQDIRGLAVASGPGSFTGLRVGLAAIKALAEVLLMPIAAVSVLEALAMAAGRQGRVIAALDAARGELYLGEYQVSGELAALGHECLLRREDFLKAGARHLLVTPDHALADAARGMGWPVLEVVRPGSDVIARLGWGKIQRGQTVSPEALEANYIRRSNAETSSPNKV